jgi:hypothetical protein
VVSMALDKQEETVRESRYFTALKAYKHGARGRKSRCLWSKPIAEPDSPRREPEPEPEPGRAQPGPPRGPGAPRRPPPGRSRCRDPRRSGRGTATRSAPWGLWPKVTRRAPDPPQPLLPRPSLSCCSCAASARPGDPGTRAPAVPGPPGRAAGEGRPRPGQGGKRGGSRLTLDSFARGREASQGGIPWASLSQALPLGGIREGFSLLTAGC